MKERSITIPYEEYLELQRYREQVEKQRVIAIYDSFKFEGYCYSYWINFESEEGLEAYMLYQESLRDDKTKLNFNQKVKPYWRTIALILGLLLIGSMFFNC